MKERFEVQTNFGKIIAEKTGAKNDYPGILIYFEDDEKIPVLVACVEHDTTKDKMQICTYNREADYPISVKTINISRKEVV